MGKEKIQYSKLFNGIDYEDSDEYAYLSHYLQTKNSLTNNVYSESAIKNLLDDERLKKLLLNGNGQKKKELKFDRYIEDSIKEVNFDVPFPPNSNPQFKFIDLFAGVGGFRLALQELNGKCVYSSEIDKYSKQVYEANFGEIPFGDIKNFTNDEVSDRQLDSLIPDHDILAAGFPCQAFSIAGKRGGFNDTRGTLFFDVARILKAKKPKSFILENVKGLRNHKSGKTLKTILNVLREDLDYFVPDPQILNARNFGVPQNRERIFIIGFRKDLGIESFQYPNSSMEKSSFNTGHKFGDVKEDQEVSVKYYLSEQYLGTLREHRRRHERKGNGFGFEIIPDKETANAIVVGGMGRERNLVHDDRLSNFEPVTNITGEVNKEGIRRMTPREWARLQGFPDNFIIDVVSDTQLYKQFGNSVPVPVVEAVGNEILELIN